MSRIVIVPGNIHMTSDIITGTDSSLLLLDRSGQGEVFTLIKGRRFSQIEVDDRFIQITLFIIIRVLKCKNVIGMVYLYYKYI